MYPVSQKQAMKVSYLILKQKEQDDLIKKFVGVFPSNFINNFINFHNLMKKKKAVYLFMIMNTDRSDKEGTHWYSILDLYLQKTNLFV